MEKADARFRAKELRDAAKLYSRVAAIPLKADQVELAKERIIRSSRANSD